MSAIADSRMVEVNPEYGVPIRNQLVRDPTPDEIRERSAEVRRTWNATRWQKETRRFRSRRWTVPEVHVLPSLLEASSA